MSELLVCAAHPAARFGAETAALLSDIAGARVICVDPPAGADTLEAVVEAVEAERCALGVERWVFWGMSGGSFLGQLYARSYPQALAGLILASAGPYFRPTVEDPACILCPGHAAWRDALAAAGLLAGPRDAGPTEWQLVEHVGWVFRRTAGPALLVSPDEPSADMRRMMPALWELDARAWLGSVRVPALVLCGSVDPIVPLVHARALATLLPGTELEVIEGAGHVLVVDARPQVESAVRSFLGQIIRAPSSST